MASYREIANALSQRYSKILVDRVIYFEPASYIFAIKNVSLSDNYFSSGKVDMSPESLIIEVLGQLVHLFNEWSHLGGTVLEFNIDRALLVIQPGDTLCLELRMISRREAQIDLAGKVTIDGRESCSCSVKLNVRNESHG